MEQAKDLLQNKEQFITPHISFDYPKKRNSGW